MDQNKGLTRETFIRNKQEYSLPVKMTVRALPSPSQGLIFQAQVYPLNLLYEYPTYIITTVSGQIDSISPSAIPMFNIDLKKVKQGMYIEKIIPNFWEYISDFQQKQGKVIQIKTYQIKMMKETKVRVYVQQIKFLNLSSQGYIIQIKVIKPDSKSCQVIQEDNKSKSTVKQKSTFSKKKGKTNNSNSDDNLNEEDDEDDNEEDDDDNIEDQEDGKIKDKDNTARYEDQINNIKLKFYNQNSEQQFTKRLTLSVVNSKIKVQNDKSFELFYDLRSGSFLGVYVKNTPQVETDTPNALIKSLSQQQQLLQKSIFGFTQHYKQDSLDTFPNLNLNKQLFYPFLFTLESRNQDEEVQDIIQSAQKPNKVPNSGKQDIKADSEVTAILESLIKMQYQTQNKNKKLSTRSKKSGDVKEVGSASYLPSLYLKHTDIKLAQNKYLQYIQELIDKDEEKNQQNVNELDQSMHSKYYKDYGIGIKLLRLQQNKLIDIVKLSENEDQSDEEGQNQNDQQNIIEQQNEYNEGDYRKEVDNIVSQRRNLKQFLKNKDFNLVKNLFINQKVFSLLFLMSEFTYIIFCLLFYNTQADQTITRFQNYQTSYLYLANTQNMIQELYKGIAINDKFYYLFDELNSEMQQLKFESVIEQFTIYQFQVDKQLTDIYLTQVGVTDQMFNLYASGKDIYVITHFESSQTTINPTNLYQGTQQILAKAYHSKRVPLGQFTIHNHDIFIMIENFSNQLLNRIIEYNSLQENEITQFIISIENNQWVLIMVGMIISFLLLICLFIFYFKQLIRYYEIVSILTTIPLSQVRNQIKKCENFSTKFIQSEEEEDSGPNDIQFSKGQHKMKLETERQIDIGEKNENKDGLVDKSNYNLTGNNNNQQTSNQQEQAFKIEDNHEGQFSLRGITSQNIRQIKHSLINWYMLLPFSFSLMALSLFIIFDSQLSITFTTQLQNFFSELSQTVQIEPEYTLLHNCLKSSIIGQDYTGVKQVYHPLTYIKNNINQMYDIIDNIQEIHYNNYNNQASSYKILFDQYFSQNDDLCSQLNSKYPKYIKLDECNTFSYGILKKGLSVILIQLTNDILEESIRIENNEMKNHYQESMSNLMYEIDMIIEYTRLMMRELNDAFIQGASDLLQSVYVYRIALTISIAGILAINFLFISLPFIQQISNQIFAQRQIINVIPLSLIFQNRHIRSYILKCYLSSTRH